ncbi:hypothetical protein KKD03_00375 [Patescibacteria group bacterium]|nr:hypothetical protein [Patescibacteria group bacterium]
MNTKNIDLSHYYSNNTKPISQKELIDAMNKHTCFTRKFAELLIRQSDPITNQFRKDKENGR